MTGEVLNKLSVHLLDAAKTTIHQALGVFPPHLAVLQLCVEAQDGPQTRVGPDCPVLVLSCNKGACIC